MMYQNESAMWLIANAHEVADIMSVGNASAYLALKELLKTSDGARAFKEMKISLLTEEWGKLYTLCEENLDLIASSVIVINCLLDENSIHENLKLKYPARFVLEPITDYYKLAGNEKWVTEKRLRENFVKRFKEAKISQ